jgi:uncharacterized membrane protein
MNKIRLIVPVIIVLSFAIGFYLYPTAPELMASHWGYKGEVNGYMPKFWALFLMPIMSLVLYLVFLVIPRIDPLRWDKKEFTKYYDGFILVFELFLFYLYLLTVLWNRGARFDMTALLVPAMGILFYYLGVLIDNAQPNWFVGIRTPWTLSSPTVWQKTHKLGGKLFKAAGVLALLGVFAGELALFFVIFPIMVISLYLTLYSYLEYGKEKGTKK